MRRVLWVTPSGSACSQLSARHGIDEDAGAIQSTASTSQLPAAEGRDKLYDAGLPSAPAAAGARAQIVQPAGTESSPPVIAAPDDEANYLFDGSQLRTYNLIVAPSDLSMIDKSPTAEMYVPASLDFEGKTFSPVRMRYKGHGGAFEPPSTLTGASAATPKIGKCSIKVDFDVDNNATFFGLKKLNFHAMGQDPSMLRERLGYGLFREMGIAAPRAAHARLLINGKLEGLFAVVEQIDGRFSRSRFGDGGKGNVYKEVWPSYTDAKVYEAALETNTKAPAVQRMLAFRDAVETSADAFAQFIDRDYMLRYIAVDRVIENDDGMFHFFCGAGAQGNNPGEFGNHNYYWYEAQTNSRFWLIPWDLDFVFEGRVDDEVYPAWTEDGPCKCGYDVYGRQRPATCDTSVRHLRSWLDDYNKKVDQLLAGPFAQDSVNAKLDMWRSQIANAVTEAAGLNGAPTLPTWIAAVTQLQAKIANARANRGRMY